MTYEKERIQENELPQLITVKELIAYMKCAPNIAYNLVRTRSFPSLKIGGKYYIIKDKIPEWLEKESKKY